MAAMGLPMAWKGASPPNEAPSVVPRGAKGGRRVYPPRITNWDWGTVAMGIS